MCTLAQLDEITKMMVDCYRVIYGDDIVEIMLYGSYARGDYTEEQYIRVIELVKVITEYLEN